MWAYRLEGPLQFARHEVERPAAESLPDGYVLLRFRAGGVCGSDIARCKDTGTGPHPQPYGRSLHEIVGDVVATASDESHDQRETDVGLVGHPPIVHQARLASPREPYE